MSRETIPRVGSRDNRDEELSRDACLIDACFVPFYFVKLFSWNGYYFILFFFHSFHCSIAIFVNGDEKKWKEDVSSFFKLLVFEEDRKLKLNDHENKMNDYCTANIILNILNNLLFIKKKSNY